MRSTALFAVPVLVFCAALKLGGATPQAEPDQPPVIVEVFSDFQCPYCGRFAPALRELERKGIDDIKTEVQFKNFPLSFHPFAQLAAQAAVAAGEQGKFWEMHDLLFANQGALTREDLFSRARSLNLDMARFEKDLDSERTKQRIEADKEEGAAKKVQGTPTVFIDGKEYSGTKSFEELSALVRADVGRKVALTEITDALMSKGPSGAAVTVDFYADLESPVSRSANYVLEELTAKYPAGVRVQFRNYPLSFHPQAVLVHDAAMTAAREGHFWQMVNYVFDHQESVGEQDLIAYAGRLGMDQAKFADALRANKYAPRIDADLADGFERGVRGSPVVFVNGKQFDGVPSLSALTTEVQAALASKRVERADSRPGKK